MRLKPIRVTPPGVDLIEVTDARRQCNVDDTDSDVFLEMVVGSVTDYLESPAGILRVCLLKQTWQETLSEFPCGAIELPVEPLIGVTKIEYIAEGATTWSEISNDQYEAFSTPGAAYVRMLDGLSWPSTATRAAADRISGPITANCRGRNRSRRPEELPPVWKVSTAGVRVRRAAASAAGATRVCTP